MAAKLNIIKKCLLLLVGSSLILSAIPAYSQDKAATTKQLAQQREQKSLEPQTAFVMNYPMNSLMLEAIFELVPSVAQKRDDEMMQLLCKLARQETSKEDSIAFLSEREGWAPKTLPSPDNELYLWVSDDLVAQQTACAAYIATTLYTDLNNDEFITNVKEDNSIEINNSQFNEVMKIRLAVAKSNAHTFNAMSNLIKQAEQLAKDKVVSPPSKEIFKTVIKDQFAKLAPYYLSQIRQFYNEQTGELILLTLNGTDYSIQNSQGEYLSYLNGELSYRVYGVDWLGNGKIMGQEHFIEVAYY